MNLVTVVFKGDLANLLYQAYSLKKNWLGKPEWIIVAEDNEETFRFIETRIKPVMEGWTVINTMAPPIKHGILGPQYEGWWRQQICKFWAVSELSTETHSLVLDAKNFLINPIDDSWFFIDGKVKMRQWFWAEEKEWVECCEFFNFDPKEKIACWNKSPCVWQKDIVQKVIIEYRKRGCDIYNAMPLPAWEFFAYWVFAQDLVEWTNYTFGEALWEEYNIVEDVKSNYKEFPFWTFHRKAATNPELVNFNNSVLLEMEIINGDLVEEYAKLNG